MAWEVVSTKTVINTKVKNWNSTWSNIKHTAQWKTYVIKGSKHSKNTLSSLHRIIPHIDQVTVAAPLNGTLLRNHGKSRVLFVFFCHDLRAQKMIFEYKLLHLLAQARYLSSSEYFGFKWKHYRLLKRFYRLKWWSFY